MLCLHINLIGSCDVNTKYVTWAFKLFHRPGNVLEALESLANGHKFSSIDGQLYGCLISDNALKLALC